MKRLSIYTILLLILFSCKGNEAPKYTIQGTGVTGGTVYLWSGDENHKSVSSVNSNGNFTMSVTLNDTVLMTLMLPDCKTIPLFAEPGVTATLEPDSTLKSGWSVKGGGIQALHDSISRVLDATDNLDKQKKIIDEFTGKYPISEVNVEIFRRYLADRPHPDNEYLRRMISKYGGILQDHRYFSIMRKLLDKKTGNVRHRLFPTFHYTTIDGKKADQGTYSDKYLLVNFCATWNPECHKFVKELGNFRENVERENFAILNISLDSDTAKWRSAIIGDSIVGDNVLDIKGMNSETLESFNIVKLPYSVLVTPYKRISEYGISLDSITTARIDSLTHRHDVKEAEKKNNKKKK